MRNRCYLRAVKNLKCVKLTSEHDSPFVKQRDLVGTNNPRQILIWHQSSVYQGGSLICDQEIKKKHTTNWGQTEKKKHQNPRWRQRGRVVRVSDLKSGGRGFKSLSVTTKQKLFLGRPQFKSSVMLVNCQLACLSLACEQASAWRVWPRLGWEGAGWEWSGRGGILSSFFQLSLRPILD